jgi:hypothetical protein
LASFLHTDRANGATVDGGIVVNAARYGKWIVDDEPATVADAELRSLIGELERPLMAGFMTAGYSALGRYIFLAAQSHRAEARGSRIA